MQVVTRRASQMNLPSRPTEAFEDVHVHPGSGPSRARCPEERPELLVRELDPAVRVRARGAGQDLVQADDGSGEVLGGWVIDSAHRGSRTGPRAEPRRRHFDHPGNCRSDALYSTPRLSHAPNVPSEDTHSTRPLHERPRATAPAVDGDGKTTSRVTRPTPASIAIAPSATSR